MRFSRLGVAGSEVPVAVVGGAAFDLRGITADIDGDFFSSGGVERSVAAMAAGELIELSEAGGLRVGAPIARPSAIYCVGMNYAAHAAESGSAPPENLVVFMKAPNTVVGPFDEVTIPADSVKTDWEVELGIVIGRRAYRVTEDPRSYIAGYVLANDLSERDWQIAVSGGQWSKGKSGPGFCPLGPELVTPDEINADDVRLRSWVNEQLRQDSRTADLIFGIDTIIRELSHYLALEPGDLILTGTPEGVALSGRFPFLRPGDVVEVAIDGLGRQRQTLAAPVALEGALR